MERAAFIAGLERHGYIRLGGGAFSQVYAKRGSDRVIKVGSEFDGWVIYALWLQDHSDNNWSLAPKIHAFHLKVNHFNFSKSWYIAVMERLDCTVCFAKRNKIMKYSYATSTYDDIRFNIQSPYNINKDLYPEAHEFFNIFYKECNGMAGWDTHDENFMIRKDGTLVLIDPFSWLNEKNKEETTSKFVEKYRSSSKKYRMAA